MPHESITQPLISLALRKATCSSSLLKVILFLTSIPSGVNKYSVAKSNTDLPVVLTKIPDNISGPINGAY